MILGHLNLGRWVNIQCHNVQITFREIQCNG
jgi:hypothetical protein